MVCHRQAEEDSGRNSWFGRFPLMLVMSFADSVGTETLEDNGQIPKRLMNAAFGQLQAFCM